MTHLATAAQGQPYVRPKPGLGVRGLNLLLALALWFACLVFAFPVFWLILTSLRPASGIYYVHRGLQFTLDNFVEVLSDEATVRPFVNSAVIATLATIASLAVTISSGYALSRFKGPMISTWFGAIYLFRCIPYISWVMPLFILERMLGLTDTYTGLLLPHIAVHVCFFSWIMKGVFDGIDPSMEYAAMIDGCTRWGAFLRIALPSAAPSIWALAILCWLYTWNEFLFALLLTGHRTPIVTAFMAQFVTEVGTQWNLMSATAALALVPAILVVVFGQRYVVRGLRI
jgi:multiple sugar transport system permease protein